MQIKELIAHAANNFWTFPKLASNNQIPPHMEYVAKRVQCALERNKEKKKIIFIPGPPRHGKSELIPVHLPAWALGNYPKKRIIIAAYAADLAEKHSTKARAIFEKWGFPLWNVAPSPVTFSRADWESVKGGGVKAVGVYGGTTGFGADIFIIDDYHRNSKEAESMVMRETVWEFWLSAVITRLHPGGIVIISATRWHDDDLVGRLLKQMEEEGDDFPFDVEIIRLPALAEENDVMGREPGEALWPWWTSANELKRIQRAVGPYVWSALYQGHPTLRGGTLFKTEHFRYYTRDIPTGDYLCWRKDIAEPIRVRKREMTRHVYVDPSLEIKTVNDPTGMLAWGYSRQHRIWLLLDRLNDRIEHTQILGQIKIFAFKNQSSVIGIEDEKLGKVLVKQSVGRDEIGGRKIPFKEIPTGGVDKYARATPMANYFENERVFLPRGAIWLSAYESELVTFPRGTHDEDVDCTGMAEYMEGRGSIVDVIRGLR